MAEQRGFDLAFAGEGAQIEVILQAGVGHAEVDDGFQLLGRRGGSGIDAQTGGGQIVQHDGKKGFIHPGDDGIAIAEIQQHRAPRGPESADQFRAQAAVAGIFPDLLDADGVGIEPHAVRGFRAAGRSQVAGQGFGVFRAQAEKVGVGRGAIEGVEPQFEQERAFEAEPVGGGSPGKAIEKTLDGVAVQQPVEILAALPRAPHQPVVDGLGQGIGHGRASR